MSDTAQASSLACSRPSWPKAEDVRAQLERILNDPLFMHSRHFPNMLRYVVEQTLAGNAAQIRERIIGIEVFGREPSYDTNADPVVRMTAREIRNRLARYYQDPNHLCELRIDLPTGSYVPVFCYRDDVVLPHEIAPVTVLGRQGAVVRLRKIGFAVLLFALGSGTGILLVLRLYAVKAPPSAIDLFWAPLLQGQGRVTVCLGEPGQDSGTDYQFTTVEAPSGAVPSIYDELRHAGHLAFGDVITLDRVTSVLDSHHKPHRLTTASQANFSELREGPILLIGIFDNRWTMHLTQNLRFGFVSKDGNAYVVDHLYPKQMGWSTVWSSPYRNLSRDYAILARFHDPTTNQPVVILGGFAEEGTEAAGEVLADPNNFAALIKNAPHNWQTMNMEAVIETDVIAGQAGPPHVLAVEFW
jgi:hypothetical protein